MKGNILIDLNEKPLLSIGFKEKMIIEIDVKDTSVFELIEMEHHKNNETNFWDVLHNARDFAEDLNRKITIILSVKGKETIIIGEKAKPSISQILSKSKNIQIKSVMEAAKLSKEILDYI